ncbi:MAG: serine protein kinase [Planctomycetota bacterium]|jgi:serine protein kinase|nr:serine protein kinase [Planctomycetota bacterium]MDP6761764.1 serine protein kinase [Planctomycetota bacterium]MDP6988421.1 serine protein kinase [Planctomycetota bacterium]
MSDQAARDPDRSFLDLVYSEREREEFRAFAWEGSFEEYLALLGRDPLAARNAWQRLYDMIESYGFEEADGDRSSRRWRLFDDPEGGGRDAVFGLDAPLGKLVQMIRAGACGFGPERRVMLLHGPVGSAKSTIARLIKRALEAYTRSDAGALYTFSWHVDGEVIPSPMNQDPLVLIPPGSRGPVEERLNESARCEYRISIEGELDPVSRHYYGELMRRYDGDWRKVVEHVRVRRLVFSEADRVGVGTFQPKDEKNQDSTELTGDLNYRMIAEYGSDSDPRAFNFDGEFNVANRGILEFVEVLKLDVAFLYDLLGATQEHCIKPRKFAQTDIDEVIIGHTNEPEYKKLQNNDLMEAFRDRTIKIDIPYNLSIADEVRIYRRQFRQGAGPGRSITPHALEMAATWAVLTRLEEPTHPNLTLLQKAYLYDGGRVSGFTPEHVREMREANPREGMSGISPRYVQDSIAACMVSDRAVIGPLDVLDSLEQGLRHHSLLSNEETRKRYTQLFSIAREQYEEIIKREVQLAIASDREAVDRLCSKYIDNVKAHVTCEKVLDAGGRERDPDERLMRSIESKIDISDSRKEDFRHELMNYIAAVHLDGETFDYRENDRLRNALELKVFEDRRDTIQLTSLVSTVVDPDTQDKIAVIRDRLMREFGYDEVSADEVLQHVSSLFSRGEAQAGDEEVAA